MLERTLLFTSSLKKLSFFMLSVVVMFVVQSILVSLVSQQRKDQSNNESAQSQQQASISKEVEEEKDPLSIEQSRDTAGTKEDQVRLSICRGSRGFGRQVCNYFFITYVLIVLNSKVPTINLVFFYLFYPEQEPGCG